MRALDSDTLSRLDPLTVVAYLRGQGWQLTGISDRIVAASLSVNDTDFELVVPLQRGLRDYRLRMGELVEAIAAAENRGLEGVLNNLLLSADVVRVMVRSSDTAN